MKRLSLLCLLLPAVARADEPVDYLRDVKPFFAKHCTSCHGPAKQKAGIRLDHAAAILKGPESGPLIVVGKASASRLVKALAGDVKDISLMPPEGRPRPTAAEIALVKRWIDAGAIAPKDEPVAAIAKSDHWSFQPLQKSPPPNLASDWIRNPIDAFVLARLKKENIAPSKDADRVTLLRRVSLDLTGLPPTPAEVADFVNDPSPDAYAKVVERLLQSPHYGERWARHWLDLARYADSNGFTIDGPRTIWPYRDWVIAALNRDQPIDQFIIEQIAGDMLPNATVSQKVATGFHRNTLFNQEGGIDQEMFRTEFVIDRVNTTGAVFLGLTVGCAQCHDHKYDPISQTEFYRLFAFFNNCDEPTLALPTPAELKAIAATKTQIADLENALKSFDTTSPEKTRKWELTLSAEVRRDLAERAPRIRDLVDKTESQRSKKESDELRDFLRQLDQVPQVLANLGDPIPGGLGSAGAFATHAYMLQFRASSEKKLAELKAKKPDTASTLVMQERAKPRDTFFLIKGDFTRKGTKVTPGTPGVLHPMKSQSPNRLDLAKWIVDPANPLTARVFVNRVWQIYFGGGLVETENDFGLQGTPPSHPELLDWLAGELMARRWSLKDLHRTIVSSSTYRQSSTHRPELTKADPRNRLLGRQNRLRLEAEVVRDVALAASGLLNPKIGGPSVFPPQPDGVFAFTQTQRTWKADGDSDRFRRGIYTYFWRSAPHPGLVAFDAPDANTTCTRRNRSNTPLQALTLLNDQAYNEFAAALAERVTRDAKTPDERLRLAFRICLAREPSTGEMDRLKRLTTALGENPWPSVARVLMNLDEFITRE